MKALRKMRPQRGAQIESVPVPALGPTQVLVRVRYASICGTDLHIYDWDAWASKTIPLGLTIGHEFVGEVVAVGSNVADITIGQLVSGEGHVVCGRCRNCLAGRRHLCAFTKGLTKPISSGCAVACAKAGSPLVILTDDGNIYWPIADTTPSSGQNEKLLPFAGQKVTATGKAYQRGGSSALVIEKIEALN